MSSTIEHTQDNYPRKILPTNTDVTYIVPPSPSQTTCTSLRQAAAAAAASKNSSTNCKKVLPKQHDRNWNEMYSRLVEYRNLHGNCLIPQNYETDRKLGRWVTNQRTRRKTLSQERREKLESIDFVWQVKQKEDFDEMFKRLVRFKEKYGNCLVPQRYKEDPMLGQWVNTQRVSYSRGTLPLIRTTKLEFLGFRWNVQLEQQTEQWNMMFEQLLQYKMMFGNCLVSKKTTSDKHLINWVNKQRGQRKKGTLLFYRFKKLDDIGFAWSLQEHKNKTQTSFDDLVNDASPDDEYYCDGENI